MSDLDILLVLVNALQFVLFFIFGREVINND